MTASMIRTTDDLVTHTSIFEGMIRVMCWFKDENPGMRNFEEARPVTEGEFNPMELDNIKAMALKRLCATAPYMGDAPTLKQSGVKDDSGKPNVGTLMMLCSRAIESVAKVADHGTKKYVEGGWLDVPNGEKRYHNAMQRHYLAIGRGERFDEEGQLHVAQVAINALYWLELQLRREEKERETFGYPGIDILTATQVINRRGEVK